MRKEKAMGSGYDFQKKSIFVVKFLIFTLMFSCFLKPASAQPVWEPEAPQKILFQEASGQEGQVLSYESRNGNTQLVVPLSINDLLNQVRADESTVYVQVEVKILDGQGEIRHQTEAQVAIKARSGEWPLGLSFYPSQINLDDFEGPRTLIFRVKETLTLRFDHVRRRPNDSERGVLMGPQSYSVIIPSALRDLDLVAGDEVHVSAGFRVFQEGEGVLQSIRVPIQLKLLEGGRADFSFPQSILLPGYTSDDFKKAFNISEADLTDAEILRVQRETSSDRSVEESSLRNPEINTPLKSEIQGASGCSLSQSSSGETSDIWGLLVLAGMGLFLLRLMRGKKKLP